MKIKTLLISLSIISCLSFLLTSCSKEDEMGIGVTAGEGPDGHASSKVLDSIPFPGNDNVTGSNFPKD
ncbi:hypothetical protein CLV62_11742 [Dysgonomonas alginatilytica]|uniref:Lipoprotein n=1 Tax=Dysgonomonas alginatilytica TaxID=1605892 RepID=A0A2V3PP96_9BACT|nr:hypothetical protein [Dysgonomonas alginatilytica]PXV62826.1 hypothetical protein CLV62_11742 [Dysgonomonas alginatilytica]